MILAEGKRVKLRDYTEEDRETYLKWMREDAKWKHTDTPWEQSSSTSTDYDERFNKYLLDIDTPRRRALIQTDLGAIGWVTRYSASSHPDACMIGIDICEDSALGRGYGEESLRLWIDYLFKSGRFHRIGLATYSFNTAMQRLAEKLGFKHEGTEREIHYWDNQWVDRLSYGLLLEEWSK